MPWLQRENNLRKVAKHDSLLGCKNQEVSVRKQVYGDSVQGPNRGAPPPRTLVNLT